MSKNFNNNNCFAFIANLDSSNQLSQSPNGPSTSSVAKMRTTKQVRPRPKTIHVETGSVDLSEASSLSSRKKGSNSNLTGM